MNNKTVAIIAGLLSVIIMALLVWTRTPKCDGDYQFSLKELKFECKQKVAPVPTENPTQAGAGDEAKINLIPILEFNEKTVVEGATYMVDDNGRNLNIFVKDIKGKRKKVTISLTLKNGKSADSTIMELQTAHIPLGDREYAVSVHSIEDFKNNKDQAVVSIK